MRQFYPNMMPIEGKKCDEGCHDRSKPCKVCPTARALKSKKPEREEIPFVKAEGVVGTLELFAYPIIDESGEISGFVEHLRDITNSKIEK